MARNINMTWDLANWPRRGQWVDITPPGLDVSSGANFGSHWIESAQSNPDWVFCCIDTYGVYRSKNGGRTWGKVGPFDSPTTVWVDPSNHLNLYVTQGVRGSPQGFRKSTDGGDTFTTPAGWTTVSTATNCVDVTMLAPDQADFNHVIMSSHSPWSGMGLSNAGIYRTQDGGATWTTTAPVGTWPVGTMSVFILNDPASGQGNRDTWIAATNGNGTWRTTNAGVSWTKVSNYDAPHGGGGWFYAPNGKLYAGGLHYPIRSSDNGITWEQIGVGTLPDYSYFDVRAAGGYLYTGQSSGVIAGHAAEEMYRSLVTDGNTFSKQPAPGNQKAAEGPFRMSFNVAANRLYAACWHGGLRVLQL